MNSYMWVAGRIKMTGYGTVPLGKSPGGERQPIRMPCNVGLYRTVRNELRGHPSV